MEKIEEKTLEILNNKFAEHLPDLYQKDVVLEAMMEYGQYTYTTRNDEVVAEIKDRISSINTNMNEILDLEMLERLQWQKNELLQLLTKLKQPNK